MIRSLLAIAIATAGFVPAQTSALMDRLSRTVLYRDVAISPDGARVAWMEALTGSSFGLRISRIANGSKPTTVTDSGGEHSEPAWSPDSSRIAFVVDTGESSSIWVVRADGTNAHRLAALRGYVAHPRWSHNGQRIAFLCIEGAAGGGPLLAAPTRTGVIDEQIHNQRIAVLEVGTGALRQISPEHLHVYDFDWSPDDSTFIASAAPGPGDNNWWIAELYTIGSESGRAKSVYRPEYQIAIPRWSPDGQRIAFIEGLMSDEGFFGGDLFTLELGTGVKPVNHTSGRRSSPSSLFWTGEDRVLFTEVTGGGAAISELSLSQGSNAIRELWRGGEDAHAFGNFPNFSTSRDGSVTAIVRSSFENAPEVWAGPAGRWSKITNGNRGLEPAWGKSINLEWESEGYRIQGWLLEPAGGVRSDGHRRGLVVVVHGGPSGAERPQWPSASALPEALSAAGYYVFMPNPRGSYGQGEQFTRANIKDFGGGDLRDVMAGIDYVLSRYPIDPDLLGITGWSYGGYMTMWTITQTNRFHAAMAGAGVANWQSYYGQNLIDRWMIPFFGASVYDDPAVYAESSPINFIKHAKTPTLIQVGEFDAECPAPQSYEYWHALRTLGVPTELVVYKDEGHMFTKLDDRVAMQDRTIAWFGKFLPGAAPPHH